MELNIEEINIDGLNKSELYSDTITNEDNYFSAHFNNIINYVDNSNDVRMSQSLNYKLNYTVKELTKICEYYKIDKMAKQPNKDDLIRQIVIFESDDANNDCVARRQTLWFYINELKTDKHMKKYVIW